MKTLTREEFKKTVFARDKGKCVFCAAPAVDAHHILDRKLFADGGYHLDNGASVCGEHHLRCEDTSITVEEVRRACGITSAALPPGIEPDDVVDKWSNFILCDGRKVAGPLFFDDAVQKLLRGEVGMYEHRFKFPRTFHSPWSLSLMNDDRRHPDMGVFTGQRVIVTEKYDGEGFTGYRDGSHARSLDSANHPSRNMAKQLHAEFAHEIPEGWRVSAENTYATHSIKYRRDLGNALPSFLMGFMVWDEQNRSLPWDETVDYLQLFGVTPVRVLYDGVYDEDMLKAMAAAQDPQLIEGYVIRLAGSLEYEHFFTGVAKYVRAKHVNTSKHWMTAEIVPNELTAGE